MDLLTYTTDDGGDSWQLRSLEPDLRGVGPLAVFDSSYLEAGYIDGVVWLRHGSVKAAAPLPADVPKKQAIKKSEFVDAERGWLLLSGGHCDPSGCSNSALLATRDGGKTISVLLKSTEAPVPTGATSPAADGIGTQPERNLPLSECRPAGAVPA